MPSSETHRDPLEMLMTEYLDRVRAGETLNLQQFAEEHPDLSEEIQELFPTLMALEKARSHQGNDTVDINDDKIESGLQLGEYQLVREIGIGGMGIVYEAIQQSVQRRVALKVLPSEFSKQPDRKERFMQEARTVARLSYKNIVPILDYGQSSGRCFFAMRLVEGVGLDWVVLRRKQDREPLTADEILDHFQQQGVPLQGEDCESDEDSLAFEINQFTSEKSSKNGDPKWVLKRDSWKQIARIGIQAARALEHAHNLGILHRDIKPGNLLLDHEGIVWVTDFGLAKSEQELSLTGANDVVGTLRYISPERFHGEVDARSDLYALGLTLIELCINRPAFSSSNRTELMRSIMEGEVISPRSVLPKFPEDLNAILTKATARQPTQRYQSAGEFIEDLRKYVRGHEIESRTTPQKTKQRPVDLKKWSFVLLLVLCVGQFLVLANYRTLFPYLIVDGVTIRDYGETLEWRLDNLDNLYRQVMENTIREDLRSQDESRVASQDQQSRLEFIQNLYRQLYQDAKRFQRPDLMDMIEKRLKWVDSLIQ